ncbi:L-rhamnose mutarotase [Mucilaginibacter sp. Bleaf8]|uniref:L-rhamnose mutarotase n=1 Tax=Mucilaginibacter sp. Bleaf8 TaxID=2834430 RepID=UPI001BCED447|nr:L-rhamnose mutarotase [Mucilaginibacter sp. Bleaf8]MBS7565740.1 L-rhamnose mutarotase [Mucilaginibacter sp. Bleaf8]
MGNFIICILLAALLITWGCKSKNQQSAANPNVKRYGSVTGLKPDSVAIYKELHAHAWPGVLKKIKECNIQNYSIYIKEIEGKPYLFSYFEYTGNDFEADMKKMAADSTTRKWWQRTDPTQLPLPDAAAKGKIWSDMEEVFHTP